MKSQKSAAMVPEVSIIMPAHNAAAFVATAVESMLAQSFEDFELLILDDASTDNTWEILQAQSDPRIRLYRESENIGVTRGLNKLLSRAGGKFIARMDADDISLPQRLALQVDFMRQNPEVWVCGGNYAVMLENGDSKRDLPSEDAEIKAWLLFLNKLAHPFVMFNGTQFRRYNIQYAEKMTYAQDYDLWIRLACQYPQARFANLPVLIGRYRDHPASISRSKLIAQCEMAFMALLPLCKQLGFFPPDPLIGFHRFIRFPLPLQSRAEVAAVFEWALKLREANEKVQFFSRNAFNAILQQNLQDLAARNPDFADLSVKLLKAWPAA